MPLRWRCWLYFVAVVRRPSTEMAGLDVGQPPDLVVRGIELALGAPSVKEDLRRIGAAAADRIFDEIVSVALRYIAPKSVTAAPGPVPPPTKSWVANVAKPVLDPVLVGFSDRLKVRLRPVALTALGVAVTTHLVAVLAGRALGRRSCPSGT